MGTLANGSIDLKSLKVAGEGATKYITTIDGGGIKVHDVNEDDNYVQIDSSGMQIWKDGISVANFGSDVQIGENNGQKAIITASRFSLDSATGISIFSALASGTPTGEEVTIDKSIITVSEAQSYTCEYNPKTGTTIEVTYSPKRNPSQTSYTKTFTAGTSATQGPITYNATTNTFTCSGGIYLMRQIKYIGVANSIDLGTFIVGSRTNNSTYGNGTASIGRELVAAGNYQTIIGTYNNNNVNNAFEIGNGDSSTRSNALTVDWNGNVNIASGAEYKVNNLSIVPTFSGVGDRAGCVVIGKLAIAWGSISITTGTSAVTSGSIKSYGGQGSFSWNSLYGITFAQPPAVTLTCRGNYGNWVSTGTYSVSTTECTAFIRLTEASTSRAISWFVCGQLA